MRFVERSYINGAWSPSAGSMTRDVINPATEEVIGRVVDSAPVQVNQAVAAARDAFQSWSRSSIPERVAALRRIADGLESRADELAALITSEVGTPLKISSLVQVAGPINAWRLYSDVLPELQLEHDEGPSLVVREPVGVAACITPWNFPLHQITAKIAPALAAGCTVVLKPSEIAPLNAVLLAEVIDSAGIPAGVFNLLFGDGPGVGELLVASDKVDLVSFTGSVRAGQRVAGLAAQSLKRTTLELGGKSAAIILDDADLPKAARGVRNSCFLNSGQTCDAHTRMLVPEHLYEEMKDLVRQTVEEFNVGDPSVPATRLGPVVSEAQRKRVRNYIHEGIASGAELITGGAEQPEGLDKGYFVSPTVFGRVSPDAKIAQEEIFGPVLSIICYNDVQQAINIANNTVYGLSAGVWSSNHERAMSVARELIAGQVYINGAPYNPLAPFGGYKHSGIGREGGKYGIEEYLEYKAIQRPR